MRVTINFTLAMGSWAALVGLVAWAAKASAYAPTWDNALMGGLLVGCLLSWLPLVVAMWLQRKGL